MATIELERTQVSMPQTEEQRIHNAMIRERYRRLQNAEADQFASEPKAQTVTQPVRASVLTPERPMVETPAVEQVPKVTEFVPTPTRTQSPVFTTEKFAATQEQTATYTPPQQVAEMPVELYTPTATATAVEAQYSLSRMAKLVMAAFTALVVVMLTLISVNSSIIRQKQIRIRNLEQKKEQLLEQNEEIQRRIQMAQSEETIREYALSQGMIQE